MMPFISFPSMYSQGAISNRGNLKTKDRKPTAPSSELHGGTCNIRMAYASKHHGADKKLQLCKHKEGAVKQQPTASACLIFTSLLGQKFLPCCKSSPSFGTPLSTSCSSLASAASCSHLLLASHCMLPVPSACRCATRHKTFPRVPESHQQSCGNSAVLYQATSSVLVVNSVQADWLVPPEIQTGGARQQTFRSCVTWKFHENFLNVTLFPVLRFEVV
eukprot:1158305-Pelagomonas_calceolata.AAC.1